MASSGSGTTVHLAGELFKALAGVDLVHVPFRGSAPAVTALVAGQVEVMFGGYEASAWFGFVVPRGTPADVVARLNGAINAALDDPGIKEKFAALAATPMRFTPGEFATFIGEETAKWAHAVKLSGATVE